MDKKTPSRKRSTSSRNVLGDASNLENVHVCLNNDLTSGNGKKIKTNLQQWLDQAKDAENQAGQPEHEQQAPVMEVSLPIENNHVLVQKTMENYVTVQQAPRSAKNANTKILHQKQKSIKDYLKRDELQVPTNPSKKMFQRSITDYIEIQRDKMIKAKTPDSEDCAQISSQVKTSTMANAEMIESQVDVHDSITQPSVSMLISFQQKNSDSEDAGIDERSIKDEKQTWNSVDVKETFKNESSIYEKFDMPISLEAKEWSTGKKLSLPQQKASPRRSCFTDAGSLKMQDNLQCLKTEEKDIQLGTVVGKGAYGVVRQGIWDGLPVAVKASLKSDNDQSNLAEAYLLSGLRHPNVVMLLAFAETDTNILLVTNYIKGHNLAEMLGFKLKRSKTKMLEPQYNSYVLFTAAQGMLHLHQRGIIHQDLKPANIMVEEGSNRGIVCDLGLGRFEDDVTMKTKEGTNAGTLAYQHIEQLNGKPPDKSGDVYSFGCVALETYNRERAWGKISSREIEKRIRRDEYPEIPGTVPEEAKALIEKCLKPASDRPTFKDLLTPLRNMAEKDVGIW